MYIHQPTLCLSKGFFTDTLRIKNIMHNRPVFVGGFRSGTSLLINLLGFHSEIAPWFETKGLCEAMRWLHVLKNPSAEAFEGNFTVPADPPGFSVEAVTRRINHDLIQTAGRVEGTMYSGKAIHERYPMGNDCIGYTLEEAEACLKHWQTRITDIVKEGDPYTRASVETGKLIADLGKLHQESLNKNCWINKTPEITRFAKEIYDSLGSCRTVYMVRNGLDVVSSAKALGWGEVESLAYNWQELLQRSREAMKEAPENYFELRYEDLLNSPVESLNEVLDFSGHSLEAERIIEHFKQALGSEAFDLTRVDKGQLEPEEIKCFAKVAGEMQESLGYSL